MFFYENFWRLKSKFLNSQKVKFRNNIDFGDQKTNNFFLKKLKKSKFYFEYGSGTSTLIANKLKKKFVSVELDKLYYKIIKKKINNNKIKFFNIGPVGEFSYPILKKKKKIINYIESINIYFKNKNYPDFVLVDGRFRVACCLNILMNIQKKSLKLSILLDDYEKRSHYKKTWSI